jgi:hypothetical protein
LGSEAAAVGLPALLCVLAAVGDDVPLEIVVGLRSKSQDGGVYTRGEATANGGKFGEVMYLFVLNTQIYRGAALMH